MSATIDLQQYLTETALVLRREGYEVARAPDGYLSIHLSGQPICKVREIGGITYRQSNLCSDELVSAKDHAYEIVKTTAEYMRAMENAPPLKVVGLGDGYRLSSTTQFWQVILQSGVPKLLLGSGILTAPAYAMVITWAATARLPSKILPFELV